MAILHSSKFFDTQCSIWFVGNDYYPFGMVQPGRKYQAGTTSYRYSINGQEKDSELNENITTALYWEYDSRIGRRWNPDPVSKSWMSPYACFSNNPIYRIDPLGNSDTTVNGTHYPDNKALEEVVIKSKSHFSKKVLDRIKDDAKLKTAGHIHIPGELQSRIRDQIKFAKNSVAQSFGDMLLLSRYQREDIVLGDRLIGLINKDDNFKKFELEALSHLKNGERSYTSPKTVLLGGDRGSLAGLFIPLPSSGQTWSATANELTWTLRNVYITATLVHNNSTDGKFTVEYHIEDIFDLRVDPGREGAYNTGARIAGAIYHDLGDNSAPHVTVDWQKKY